MKMFCLTGVVLVVAAGCASGQTNIAITGFDNASGQLVFSEVAGATNYFAEQSASLDGAWTNVGGMLDTILPSGTGSVTCSVPVGVESICFYRIAGQIMSTPPGMVLIPAGTFDMGDSFAEGDSDELPVHSINVSAFYMEQYEVTKAQWDVVYNWALMHGYGFDNVGSGKALNHPVNMIFWYDAVKWCNARSEMEGRTPCYMVGTNVYRTGQSAPDCDWSAFGYRLPTEAEWEIAARGGSSGLRFPWGNTINHDYANYFANGSVSYDTSPYSNYTYHPDYDDGTFPYTSPVGSFAANGYGLYDMAGNVWEMCWDQYGSTYYASSSASNPRGPSSGTYRVRRGGSWSNIPGPDACRAASRNYILPYNVHSSIGFRTVMPAN